MMGPKTARLSTDLGSIEKEKVRALHFSLMSSNSQNYFHQGNVLFKAGNYAAAIASYTKGIQVDPMNPTFPLNRAMCYLKLEKYIGNLTVLTIIRYG